MTRLNNKYAGHTPCPAQLWIGNQDILLDNAIQHIQKQLCTNNGCGVCTACMQIRTQQHHSVLWLKPAKQYTREQLEPLFRAASFALQKNEQQFFVLQKADLLTTTCANSLLKLLEEPPAGYHFLLLATQANRILPTIRSRCTVQTFTQTTDNELHEKLFQALKDTTKTDPNTFLRLLDQSKINEHESIELINRLLEHSIALHKKALTKDKQDLAIQSKNTITALSHALKKPPMPGSSKLFWKNLFLQLF